MNIIVKQFNNLRYIIRNIYIILDIDVSIIFLNLSNLGFRKYVLPFMDIVILNDIRYENIQLISYQETSSIVFVLPEK